MACSESEPDNRRATQSRVETARAQSAEALAQGEIGELMHLLVLERESSRVVRLPTNGEVTIGRGDDADLVVNDPAVSRKHAKITVAAGEAKIADLGSRNGTKLNGEVIAGVRPLIPDDMIAICGVTLVFHSQRRPQTKRVLAQFRQFQRRAAEEIERCLAFERHVSVFVLAMNQGFSNKALIADAVLKETRLIDTVAWGGNDQLCVLMPETDAKQAPSEATRLLGVIQSMAPQAKVGFAACPTDAAEASTLIASAREAAIALSGATIEAALKTWRAIQIDDRAAIVCDPTMSRVYALLERLANVDLPVLIIGETGTGKDLAAAALHHWSPRKAKRFVTLNCAAIHESLVESELFGHEKGAFSGAVCTKPGLLETGAGGTVLLDEIGELSSAAQAKLLRVLETKKVTRIGDVHERDIDIRIVAATNRNLQQEVKSGKFRQDLFYRLSGATVWLPPLRDRRSEISPLAQVFIKDACANAKRPIMTISPGAQQELAKHSWPGNVRELKHLMDLAAATILESVLESHHLTQLGFRTPSSPPESAQANPFTRAAATIPPCARVGSARWRPLHEEIEELTRNRITAALAATGGNQTRAAELISMPLRTFVAKMKQYNLPAFPSRERA